MWYIYFVQRCSTTLLEVNVELFTSSFQMVQNMQLDTGEWELFLIENGENADRKCLVADIF